MADTPANVTTNKMNVQIDEICDDPNVAHYKQLQQQKFERHARLASIAETSRFIAGPMFAIGASALIAIVTGAAAMSTIAIPITLLTIAAAALTTAVASSYAAHKVWTEGQFNNYEISAKSTARHIVQEMEAHHMGVPAQQQPQQQQQRADGKSWQEYVSDRATDLGQQRIH